MDKESPPPHCYDGKVHKREKTFCRKKRARLARECALEHSFLINCDLTVTVILGTIKKVEYI